MRQEKKSWEDAAYSFFSHRTCEYFPCHKTAHPEDFNCLFCYCPLYTLGPDCGGSFVYRANGVKDCSGCMLPHRRENFGLVTSRFQEIAARMAKEK